MKKKYPKYQYGTGDPCGEGTVWDAAQGKCVPVSNNGVDPVFNNNLWSNQELQKQAIPTNPNAIALPQISYSGTPTKGFKYEATQNNGKITPSDIMPIFKGYDGEILPDINAGRTDHNGNFINDRNVIGDAIDKGFNYDSDGVYRKQEITKDKNKLWFNDKFKVANTAMDITRLIANNLQGVKDDREEREKLLKARYKTANYNPYEDGLNQVPVYMAEGGHAKNDKELAAAILGQGELGGHKLTAKQKKHFKFVLDGKIKMDGHTKDAKAKGTYAEGGGPEDPVKGFNKETLYVDKGKNKLYYYEGDKLVEREILTGQSPEHLMNFNGDAARNKVDRVTPIGMFDTGAAEPVYGGTGINVKGTSDKMGIIAVHPTYHPEERDRYYNNNNLADNKQSYGCINCNKADSARIAALYANKKVQIYDSTLSDSDNTKYSVMNDVLKTDHTPEVYTNMHSRFKDYNAISYVQGQDGILRNGDRNYDPTTQTIGNDELLQGVTVTSHSNNKKYTTPTENTNHQNTNYQNNSNDNGSIVDYLASNNQKFDFKSRENLAKENGIKNYKGTAEQNIKLLNIIKESNKNTYAEGGGPEDPKKANARKVKTVPTGYIPVPDLPNYYHNPKQSSSSTTPTQTNGPKMSDADWAKYVAGKKAQQSSDDYVYIEPQTVATSNHPVKAFDGQILYDTNKHATGMYRVNTRNGQDPNTAQTNSIGNWQDIEYSDVDMYGKPKGAPFMVPGDVFSNQIVRGTDMVQYPDILNKYRNPIVAKYATGGDINEVSENNQDPNGELEKGEVFQQDDGNIQKVAESEPTHEDGGSMQSNVDRVLEDTSDKRKDPRSKALLISPNDAKELTGFKPKGSTSHSKLFEKASEFHAKKFKFNEKKVADNLNYVENNGGIAAQNSLDENLKLIENMTNKQDIFDKLFDHQEGIKSELDQQNIMQYGGTRKYALGGSDDDYFIDPYTGAKTKKGGTTPTGKDNRYNKDKEYLNRWESVIPGISKLPNDKAQTLIYNYSLKNNPAAIKSMWTDNGNTALGRKNHNFDEYTTDGVFKPGVLDDKNVLGDLSDAYVDGFFGRRQLEPPTAATPAIPQPNASIGPVDPNNPVSATKPSDQNPNINQNLPLYGQPKPVVPSKVSSPLGLSGGLGNLLGYIDATGRTPVDFEQLDRPPIKVHEVNPLPTLLQNQGDYNAVAEQLPTNGVGMGNLANLAGNKYKVNNEVLAQYENANKGKYDQVDQYNDQAQYQNNQFNFQLREQAKNQILTSKEKQRLQKSEYMNGLFKAIDERNSFDKNANLLLQLSPYFNEKGEFNQNKYQIATKSKGDNTVGGFKYVTDPETGQEFRILIGDDGKLVSGSKVVTDSKAVGAKAK